MSEAERRHEPRVTSIDFVTVSEFHPENFRTLVTLGERADLSHDGLRLELNHPLPLRSEVDLTVAVGGEAVDVKGRVCYLEEHDPNTLTMGIKFTEVPDESRRAIDAFLEMVEPATAG